MTRFGQPGRFKDIFGMALVAAAFVLLGLEAAPATGSAESGTRTEAVTGCAEGETTDVVEDVTVRI